MPVHVCIITNGSSAERTSISGVRYPNVRNSTAFTAELSAFIVIPLLAATFAGRPRHHREAAQEKRPIR